MDFFFLQLCLPNGNGVVRKCECFGGSCTLIAHDSNLYGNIGSNRVQLIMESQGRHSMHLFIFNNSSILYFCLKSCSGFLTQANFEISFQTSNEFWIFSMYVFKVQYSNAELLVIFSIVQNWPTIKALKF